MQKTIQDIDFRLSCKQMGSSFILGGRLRILMMNQIMIIATDKGIRYFIKEASSGIRLKVEIAFVSMWTAIEGTSDLYFKVR